MMKKDSEKKNWLEWSVTISSGILVLFTLGFLIYQIVTEEETPPDIVISLGPVAKKDGGYSVPIIAFNYGTSTAQNVTIEVIAGDAVEEKAQISFQYLPRKSSVKGWVSFSIHPQPKALKSRIVGYSVP